MERILDTLARASTTRPVRTLILAVLLSLPAFWYATGVRISTSRTALVADDDPNWARYMAFAHDDAWGWAGSNGLVCVIERVAKPHNN